MADFQVINMPRYGYFIPFISLTIKCRSRSIYMKNRNPGERQSSQFLILSLQSKHWYTTLNFCVDIGKVIILIFQMEIIKMIRLDHSSCCTHRQSRCQKCVFNLLRAINNRAWQAGLESMSRQSKRPSDSQRDHQTVKETIRQSKRPTDSQSDQKTVKLTRRQSNWPEDSQIDQKTVKETRRKL